MAEYIATAEEFTKIADAIREKGGTAAPIAFPDGFYAAILSIQTGGGGGSENPIETYYLRFPEKVLTMEVFFL